MESSLVEWSRDDRWYERKGFLKNISFYNNRTLQTF